MTIKNKDVAKVFSQYSPALERALLELRKRILKVAKETDGVGPIEEALRWGEPAYLTSKTKSGSTIRISAVKNQPDRFAMYVNCKTDLLARYREIYPDEFCYEGKRAVVFSLNAPLPGVPLDHIIAMALTYHLKR